MRKSAALVLVLPLLLCGCRQDVPASEKRTAEMMGTFVSVTVYDADAAQRQDALDAVFARAEALEQVLSPTIGDSELCRLNAAACDQPVTVSADLAAVLDAALFYQAQSGGALDCTLGGLIDLWGIGTDHPRVPAPAEIAPFLPDGSPRIQWDGRQVAFSEDSVQLHFGAVAKGYIADEMKKTLADCGMESALIVLGGNVHTLGTKPDGSPWEIAVTDPFTEGAIAGSLHVSGESVVTSGDYERYFEENGVRYHHILDPADGFPADSGLASATIIADSSLACDALSTAVFVLGPEAGMTLIESLPDTECILIETDGMLRLSSGMEAYDFAEVTP